MNTREFFEFVITSNRPGWLPICASLPDGSGWRQYWQGWPDDADTAVELVNGLKDEGLNVFYSPHLFREKDAHKEHVIDSRTLYADMDDARPDDSPLAPSLLKNSSDNRYQAYFLMNDWIPAQELERLNKRVAWGIDKADHAVWSLGHMLRVPGTLNWKYTPPQRVRVHSYNSNLYLPHDFEIFKPLSETEPLTVIPDDEWIEEALKVPAGFNNAAMFFESNKHRIREGLHIYYYSEAPDRSTALWALMRECFLVGMKREEVYLIAYHSKNNKFRFLRYSGKRELAKDVIRAEREAFSGPTSIRGRIDTARRSSKSLNERRANVALMAKNQLNNHGKFVHVRGGSLWYIQHKQGKPIPITNSATTLNVLLEEMFGLNASEAEHAYTVNSLITHTAGLPVTGELGSLSHYLPNTGDGPTILLHTGAKDVVRITPTTIDIVNNGYHDIVFKWNEHPFIPDLDSEYDQEDTWCNSLFELSLRQLSKEGLTAEQAMAVLKSWLMMLLMRNEISSRPILAIFGQKGSGKSTLFKKVYALLYGQHKSVGGLGKQEEFDYAMASDPLHVLDNLDVWERWLPDRLARAAGISEITRRKLYTDLDVVTLRIQAILGITAHAPKFGREDVVDRLLMLNLERVDDVDRLDETPMLNAIVDKRGKYWGQIVRDAQRVLQEPTATRVASFRVMDFSQIGQRIANALHYSEAFYSGIQTIVDQQRGFILDEDGMLVNVIDQYIKRPKYPNDVYHTPAKLWGMFDAIGAATGDHSFAKQYGNSVKLGRKLWTMLDSLKQRFVVEWKYDPQQKTRVWRFDALPQSEAPDNGTEAQ